jgi:alkylation response protein AidB-like acyl-CoA dehydrogenase
LADSGGALHPSEVSGDSVALAREVGRRAAPFAAIHDRDATFVHEGYDAIRAVGYGKLAVPRKLGGGGHGLPTICRGQATLARHCANTSLAIAMHHHSVLSLKWRWEHGDDEVEPILRRIAEEGLVLASSGTLNPAMLNVTAVFCDGGFLVNGSKRLCSGAPGADVLFTAAKLGDEDDWRPISVLVPLRSPGVEIVPDWDAMGMRGSGSNTVRMTDVFVPVANALYLSPRANQGNARVSGDRPSGQRPGGLRGGPSRGDHRPPPGMLMPGLHISLAVITSVYFGAAAGVRDNALRLVSGTPRADVPGTFRLAGMMTQEWRTAQWVLEGLIQETTDDSIGTRRQFVATMLGKRQVLTSSIHIVELAMEMVGSRSYMKDQPFEQALRDVRAGITHPLPPEATLAHVGATALARAAAQPATD